MSRPINQLIDIILNNDVEVEYTTMAYSKTVSKTVGFGLGHYVLVVITDKNDSSCKITESISTKEAEELKSKLRKIRIRELSDA